MRRLRVVHFLGCILLHTILLLSRYYINSEGVLITEQNGTVAKTPPGEYCFEAVLQHNGYNKQPVFSRLDVDAFEGLQQIGVRDGPMFSRQMAMVCFDDEDGDYSARKKNSARGTPEEFVSWFGNGRTGKK